MKAIQFDNKLFHPSMDTLIIDSKGKKRKRTGNREIHHKSPCLCSDVRKGGKRAGQQTARDRSSFDITDAEHDTAVRLLRAVEWGKCQNTSRLNVIRKGERVNTAECSREGVLPQLHIWKEHERQRRETILLEYYIP